MVCYVSVTDEMRENGGLVPVQASLVSMALTFLPSNLDRVWTASSGKGGERGVIIV